MRKLFERGKVGRVIRLMTNPAYRFAAALCLTCLAQVPNARAQNAPTAPPPIRMAPDQFGVDLVSGSLNVADPEISIGKPDAGGLSLVRTYYLNGWRDNLVGTIAKADPTYTVSLGGSSESFTLSGGVYAPAQGQASKLTYDSGLQVYTYTSSAGVIASFSKGYAAVGNISGGGIDAFITSATYPNGVKVTYTYAGTAVCVPGACFPIYRLQSVSNNFGYQIHFDYALNGTPDSSTLGNWIKRTRATALNVAVDYCDPGAATCPAFTVAWPRVDYGGTQGVSETVTDLLSQVTTYTYDGSGRLTSVRAPSSTVDTLHFLYDSSGRVQSASAHGVTSSYSYSDSGSTRTTTVTDPLSHTHVVISDLTTSLVSSEQDGLSRATSYQYDTQGRRTRVTFQEGNYVSTSYDARGNVTEMRSVSKTPGTPADLVWSASYDTTCSNPVTCNKPNYTKDPQSAQTDYTYDPGHGGPLTITAPAADAGGVRPQQRFTYTGFQAYYKNASGSIVASGQTIQLPTMSASCRTLASCTGGADETRVVTTYGSTGVANNLLPTQIASSDGAGNTSSTVGLGYDSIGNLTTVDGPLPGVADVTVFRFDALRRQVGIVHPDPDGAGPRIPAAIRNSYDPQSRLVTVETGTVSSQSDAAWAGFVTATTTTTTYDDGSRPIKIALSGGGVTSSVQQISYDAAGRIDCAVTRMNPSVFSSLPASACSLSTQGSQGPDRILKYGYDAADEQLSVTNAFGTSSATTLSATYTPNGRQATLGDGKSNLTTLEYDGHDRMFRTRYPNPSTPGQSSNTDYEQLTFDLNSNVTSVRRRDGQSVGLSRDTLNRLRIKTVPGASTVYFSYDNQGRVTSALFGSSSGPGLVNTYDASGRIVTRTSFGHMLSYQYDAAGNRTRITHPDGFYAGYAYNAASQLTSIVDNSGVTLASFVYDDLGHRSSLSRASGAGTGYGYDAVGRLTSLTQDLAGTGYDNTVGLTYSSSNQITQRTQSNDNYSWLEHSSLLSNASFNGLNQETVVASASLGYDSRGNLTTGNGAWNYGYDAENHLTTASSGSANVSLSYDPTGMLNKMTPASAGSTEFLYDGADLVAEYDSSGNVLRRFVHGPGVDEPIVWYEGSGTSARRWLHTDERGSIVATSDGSGTAIALNTYSAYGETDMSVGAPFKYTGQLALPDLGLYYYKARFYAPTLGRFLQTDPAGYASGMNLYGYVDGDPENQTDPSGLCEPSTPEYSCIDLWGHRPPSWETDYDSLTFSPSSLTAQLDDWFQKAISQMGLGALLAATKVSPPKQDARSLNQCEKAALSPYIPASALNSAVMHQDTVPWYTPSDALGITVGNDIYFRPGVYDPAYPVAAAGIGILGHELVHVVQYSAGMTRASYLWSLRNAPVVGGYRNTLYERPAYAVQDIIQKALNANNFQGCMNSADPIQAPPQ
jgi:RHS repeat-associated protein